MAAKTQQDFTKVMQDLMGSFPVDTAALQDTVKNQAALGEKLSKVALEAAEKSSEITSKWTKETLNKVGSVATAQEDPADYAKAVTEFASSSAELAAENMAAFAEVAKKVQMDTVELMLATGKEMGEDATKAVKKATDEVTKATKVAAK